MSLRSGHAPTCPHTTCVGACVGTVILSIYWCRQALQAAINQRATACVAIKSSKCGNVACEHAGDERGCALADAKHRPLQCSLAADGPVLHMAMDAEPWRRGAAAGGSAGRRGGCRRCSTTGGPGGGQRGDAQRQEVRHLRPPTTPPPLVHTLLRRVPVQCVESLLLFCLYVRASVMVMMRGHANPGR